MILAALAAAVFAQQLGCCCDPIVRTGSIMNQSACVSPFVFVPIPAVGFVGCPALCNATNITAPPTVPPSCAAPGYTPPVSNLFVLPVKGEKAVQIDFNLPCPVNHVKIYRCQGSGCTNFTLLTTLGSSNSYKDESADLLWDEDYNYKIIANYKVSGDSTPATAEVNTGDLECWYQTTNDLFCIAPYYYDQFKSYLKEYGYKIASADDFKADFDSEKDSVFNDFYRKSWRCNDMNQLSKPAPQASCTEDEICISDGSTAKCVESVSCDLGGDFGLYSDVDDCEGEYGEIKYCFLDKSTTVVDKCYPCNPQMTCYDYHSEDACLRDNCGAGQCAWTDVFPDLGIGVCYDTRFDACSLCQARPSSSASNKEGFNEVFDACTEEKARALSSDVIPCFFNKNTQEGQSCDYVDCTSYTQTQCSSPAGGIQLNSDNSIKVGSNDACQISVCQYSAETGCVKNANGASGVGWSDCLDAEDPELCEKDYFPPETIAVLTGEAPGKHDYIDLIINDKTSKTGKTKEMQGKPGYKTYLCIVSSNNSCNIASAFPITTTKSRLIINDLNLQDGQDIIGKFSEGNNKVKFYSVDPNKNLEVIKEATVFACDKCSGPNAINITVTGANEVNGRFYTKVLQPSIKITFDEPAELIASSLDKAGVLQSIASSPASGLNYQYTFMPNNQLSEGVYRFSVNAKDDNGVSMDVPVVFDLHIDTTPPTVVIAPEDGTEFETKDVAVALNFSEPVFFNKTTLDEVVFINEFAKESFPIYLSRELSSKNSKYFSGIVTNLKAGLKIVNVDVTDYAGNVLRTKSYFSVFAGPPKIRMMHPSWGISSVFSFNVTVESSTKAKCKYIYDVPAPPPATQFDSLNTFDSSDGIYHVINQVTIPYGDTSTHSLHVYCKAGEFNISRQSFKLFIDSTAPKIVSAYANPDPVVEPVETGAEIYSTRLQVQTDEEGFCKYSADKQDFKEMEGFFPGFDVYPKKSHSVAVNVSEVKGYTYYVACKDKAELLSSAKPITFTIDLTALFAIKSTTEPYSSTELFDLRIESNKRSFCFFGEDKNSISNCFGACEFTNGHAQPITKPAGTYTFYVKCNTGSGGESSNVLNITVTVDTSSPMMEYVDDSSTLPGEPDISWYPGKLKVKFKGKDPETKVIKYYYLLETAFARELVVNWTPSLELNGTPIFVKANLSDGQRYVFRVRPVNLVGLVGNFSSSDGVTVDFSKIPPVCANGEKDANETDIDCGGMCAGCAVGKHCVKNNDCDSLYCAENVCAEPSCTDGVRNGQETDIDCGGPECPKCMLNKTCAENTDCDSGSCLFGKCAVDTCKNGVLDGTESDIDCGGACPARCGSGMNCNLPGDCAEDLACIDNTCSVPLDLDEDGVPDYLDICPNTLPGVPVDAQGCQIEEVPVEKPSLLWTLIKFLLIIAVLGGLGFGGYYAYKKGYLDKVIAKFRKAPPAAPEIKPAVKVRPKPRPAEPTPEERIAALRKFAKKKERPAITEEFVPLEKLKTKKRPKTKAFEKLKKLKSKKKASKKKSKEDAIAKLRKIRKK